ncbi:hypothetical protein HOLleu_38631 [Holothuria leucospilota]|uniref:Uncharacterized protein n=1 Tax=Holothuria leucospilota TaxID=206669 RepID=A0A9Q0YIY9_HOLLE|nr:hypothetical protein HOLleu_38631 [Holothuria leucospilota]
MKANMEHHREWNTGKTRGILRKDTCSRLLFAHVLIGCDTLRIFGIGKQVALKQVQSNADFQRYADLFTDRYARREDIIDAGEKALASVHDGEKGESIHVLRYKHFCEVSKTNTFSEPHTLPPTSVATHYHSLRVYFQIQTWRETTENLKPEEWRWKLSDSQLLPIKTHLPAAPERLTKIFRCNCKTGCNTSRCTCKKMSIECTWMCGTYKGVSCANSIPVKLDAEDAE